MGIIKSTWRRYGLIIGVCGSLASINILFQILFSGDSTIFFNCGFIACNIMYYVYSQWHLSAYQENQLKKSINKSIKKYKGTLEIFTKR